MVLVQILKRRDAAAVLVAVVIGLVLAQLLPLVTRGLATELSGIEDNSLYNSLNSVGDSWAEQYLFPFVWIALQLLLLEVIARVYIWVAALLTSKK